MYHDTIRHQKEREWERVEEEEEVPLSISDLLILAPLLLPLPLFLPLLTPSLLLALVWVLPSSFAAIVPQVPLLNLSFFLLLFFVFFLLIIYFTLFYF